MSAAPYVRWQVSCDAPRCREWFYGDPGMSRAQVRRHLAKLGWTVKVGDGPLQTRQDFCPRHKPDGGDQS